MKPTELLEKIKDLIAKGDIDAAKKFIDEHKDDLGDYLDKAKALLASTDVKGLLDKAKGFFK